jgi:transcriptional regulator with PAS, ATPase and Fis domain
LFRRARDGTIFWTGEMPLSLQPKLLRVLEEKTVLPVRSTTPVKVNVRILAASNRDLNAEVEASAFAKIFIIGWYLRDRVPPLRKRLEDLPALVEHLIRRHNLEMKNGVQGGRQRDYADSYVAALER